MKPQLKVRQRFRHFFTTTISGLSLDSTGSAILTADQTARNDKGARTAALTIGANAGVRPGAIKIAPTPAVASTWRSTRLFRFPAMRSRRFSI
jgi:hypothetical protein